MFRKISLLLLATLLFSSCVTITKAPSWIENTYDRTYNKENYLVAVGSAESRENAINNAFSNLAQIFDSQISSTLLATSDVYQDDQLFYSSESMVDTVLVKSEADSIIGSEVVNTYVDSNNKVWVRVVLDKKKQTPFYEKELKELGTPIKKALKVNFDKPLESYFELLKVVKVATKHQQRVVQIFVLSGKIHPSLLKEVQILLNTLANSISVEIVVEAKEAKAELESTLKAHFSSLGFKVAKGPYLATVKYTDQLSTLTGGPYIHINWSLDISLANQREILATFKEGGRVSGLTEEDAKSRALKEALLTVTDGFIY